MGKPGRHSAEYFSQKQSETQGLGKHAAASADLAASVDAVFEPESPEAPASLESGADFYAKLAARLDVAAAYYPDSAPELAALAANSRTLAADSGDYLCRRGEMDPSAEVGVRERISDAIDRTVEAIVAPAEAGYATTLFASSEADGDITRTITRSITDLVGAPAYGTPSRQNTAQGPVEVFTKETAIPGMQLVSQSTFGEDEDKMSAYTQWTLERPQTEPSKARKAPGYLRRNR